MDNKDNFQQPKKNERVAFATTTYFRQKLKFVAWFLRIPFSDFCRNALNFYIQALTEENEELKKELAKWENENKDIR